MGLPFPFPISGYCDSNARLTSLVEVYPERLSGDFDRLLEWALLDRRLRLSERVLDLWLLLRLLYEDCEVDLDLLRARRCCEDDRCSDARLDVDLFRLSLHCCSLDSDLLLVLGRILGDLALRREGVGERSRLADFLVLLTDRVVDPDFDLRLFSFRAASLSAWYSLSSSSSHPIRSSYSLSFCVGFGCTPIWFPWRVSPF